MTNSSQTMAPDAALLSNGRYTTVVTDAGAGYSAFEQYALTRWTADATRDADGFFVYVRDAEGGACWSAGLQPVRRAPERYEARFEAGRAAIRRADDEIGTAVDVCVSPDD